MHNDAFNTSGIYDTAHAVHKYISSLPSPIRHLLLRPVNYQQPHKTSWWLVPSQHRPVYRYSKLFFHSLQTYSPNILAGFSFERGVGRQLSDLVDTAFIMQTNWYWRRFINDVLAGVMIEPINTIQRRSHRTVLTVLELYSFNHLRRRTLETSEPDDCLVFQINEDADTITLQREATHQLQVLNQVSSCRDLVLTIEMEPAFSWHMLRFTFGVDVNPHSLYDKKESIINLWRNTLAPWMPLLG